MTLHWKTLRGGEVTVVLHKENILHMNITKTVSEIIFRYMSYNANYNVSITARNCFGEPNSTDFEFSQGILNCLC